MLMQRFTIKVLFPSNSHSNIFFLVCDYHGKQYKYGESFHGMDGCSNCYCGTGGHVTCNDTLCGKFARVKMAQ